MVHEDRLWVQPGGSIAGYVWGDLPNKSNQRKIGRVRGRPIIMKSKEALEIEERFKTIVSASDLGPAAPLVGATSQDDVKRGIPFLFLDVTVYGKSFARDLDCELLPDLLQKNGVINNDRAIRRKAYRWVHDPKSPRVEFEVGVVPRIEG